MENQNKETKDRRHVLDWAVAAIALVALVVCYFFWGCKMDLWVTLLCAILVLTGSILLQMKHNKAVREE